MIVMSSGIGLEWHDDVLFDSACCIGAVDDIWWAVDVGYDWNDKGSDILLNGNYNEETRGDNGDYDVYFCVVFLFL